MECAAWTRSLRGLLIAITLSGVAGCTKWPPEGAGGMAELEVVDHPRLSELTNTLDDMTLRGADTYAASDMVEARTLIIRARRELVGDLLADAELDMDRAQAALRTVAMRLATSRTKPTAKRSN